MAASRPGMLRSSAGAAAAVGAAMFLVRLTHRAAVAALGSPRSGHLTERLAVVRPDDAVAVVILAIGAVAAVVLAVGMTALTTSAIAHAVGHASHLLDEAAARLTPAVVRRAVAVTVTAGLGVIGTAGMAGASEIDLGWAVTAGDGSSTATTPDKADATAAPTSGPATGSPAGTTGAADPVPSPAPTAAETDPASTRAAFIDPTAPATPQTTGPTGPTGPTGTTVNAAPGTTTNPVASLTAAVAPAPVSATAAAAPVSVVPAVPTAPTPTTTVEVQRGDSLWSIAAAHLPAGASDADIARAWPAWFAANREVIGPDPALIQPGQHLTQPTSATQEQS